ncbi:MAG TPA: endonuclease III [Planctomycetes bacterium]|nr:endonuclease III [Planctomycetota bacterium]
MKKLSTLSSQRHAQRLLAALENHHPNAETALAWENPWQLLVAVILSAQCTDERVNLVTPPLFAKWPTPEDLAAADIENLRNAISSINFYNNKAKHIHATAKLVSEKHGGKVPQTMDELIQLPGVARKTANCVLGTGFGKAVGIVVDTHVGRLSRRMGLTAENNPIKVEKNLIALFPAEKWVWLSHALIDHGRSTCTSRKAKCDECDLEELCPKIIDNS